MIRPNREAGTAGVVLHPDRASALAADRREGERFEHGWRVDAGRFGILQPSATALRLPTIRAHDVHPLDHWIDAFAYSLRALIAPWTFPLTQRDVALVEGP